MIADEERIEHCDAIHSVKEDRWVVPGYGEGIVNIVYTMCGEAARLDTSKNVKRNSRADFFSTGISIVSSGNHIGSI